MKEIGSEFWNNKTVLLEEPKEPYWLKRVDLLAGRTAIALVAKELKQKSIKRIYMPSYFCSSMLEPFIKADFLIQFYQVVWNYGELCGKIDFNLEFEALFIMQYFGFESRNISEAKQEAKRRGKLVIEDKTHSFFQRGHPQADSDYEFASLRKWCSTTGGTYLSGLDEMTFEMTAIKYNKEYAELRRGAAIKKEYYMKDNKPEYKEEYLKMFRDAETILENHYENCRIDQRDKKRLAFINWDKMAAIRKRNAELLIQNLRYERTIQLLYNEVRTGDVPLFVPVLVKYGKRDCLRSYLKQKRIYCPVHWERTPLHRDVDAKFYHEELSIPCDQRYGKPEMLYIIREISNWARMERENQIGK